MRDSLEQHNKCTMEFHSQPDRLPNVFIIYPVYRQCIGVYTLTITNGWGEYYNTEVVELSLSLVIKTTGTRLLWRVIWPLDIS